MKKWKTMKITIGIVIAMMMIIPVFAVLPSNVSATQTYTVHYRYYDGTNFQYIQDAYVALYRSSTLGGSYSKVADSHTDSSGTVTFDVGAGYYLYCTIKASDDDQVEILNTNDNNNDYKWDQSSRTLVSSGQTVSVTESIYSNTEVWSCYSYIRTAHLWQLTNSGTSSDVSRVHVYYPDSNGPECDWTTGDIKIASSSEMTSQAIVTHEYGHHVQYYGQSGFSYDAIVGKMAHTTHYLYTEYSSLYGDAAFAEGWAEFFSGAVRGSSYITGGNIDS
ncbi:MAG: hypothetical protein LLG16_01825, partial [Euryarchaeota archaeon]|nr:hypothetical protein [Euryarchaeota archaeon]